MATVRMSSKLIYEIESEAKKQFDNVNKKQPWPIDLADRVYNDLYVPFMNDLETHVINKHHTQGLFKEFTSSDLHIAVEKPAKEGEIYADRYEIPMTAERKQFGGSRYGESPYLLLKSDNTFSKEIKEVINFNEDLQIKKSLFLSKVSNALTNFTTLNQALKAWPALDKLITDPWALQRINEKVQRKAKAKEQRAEIQIEETELNSVILTNSLMGDN